MEVVLALFVCAIPCLLLFGAQGTHRKRTRANLRANAIERERQEHNAANRRARQVLKPGTKLPRFDPNSPKVQRRVHRYVEQEMDRRFQ